MFKKGQVTIFIIIGIVLVLSVGIVLLIRSETTRVWVEKVTMPEDVMPVREYVQSCLVDVAREGINEIGVRGGYASYEDIPEAVRLNPRARIDIFPAAGAIVPLWYYDDNEYKPKLYQMQNFLAKFVEKNIDKCLGDFEGFKAKFDIERLSAPSVRKEGENSEVKDFGEEGVSVYMIYKLKITDRSDGKETKLSLFESKVPVRLREMYRVAEQIYNAENSKLFLEKQVIDLMSLNENVVPITDVKLECNAMVKKVSDIKKNIQGLVQFNLPNTIINGTQAKELRPYDWYAGLHQTYDLGIKSDAAVEFLYQSEWGMDLLITPNQGRIIRANPLRLYETIPTCILQYHFVYDINFPVMISIMDTETRNHESFIFNFAMPVVINHNEGAKIPNPKSMVFDTPLTASSEEFCEQYPKTPMTFTAVDRVRGDDLVDVGLTYRCGAYECSIGNITMFRGLTAQVPKCTQAVVTATKEGYLNGEARVDATKTNELEVKMTPAKKIKFKVLKTRTKNPGITFNMEDTETAVVTLTNDEYSHSAVGIYSKLEPDMSDIEILSRWNHKYNVDIVLLSNESIIGGYNQNWTVEWRDFITAKELVFYVYENPDIKKMSGEQADDAQYAILLSITELSKNVPKPEFKQ